jgi:hypothetical protein
MPRSTQLVKVLAISLCLAPALAPALAACSFSGGDGEGDGQGGDCDFSFQPLCGLSFEGTRTFTSQTLDTSVDSVCSKVVPANASTGAPELCVISAATIEVVAGATLRAIGSRPLVLAASESIQVVGTIDASSKRATTTPNQPESLGAGAQSAPCSPFARAVVDGQEGASGGAGGSLRGDGGGGGSGNITTAPGGLPNPKIAKLSVLRGGCRGQAGGASTGRANGGAGGTGGPGGGSIYLAAGTSILIQPTGAIAVNGAGGGGGATEAGGGGGGSGGLLVLEAPTILQVGRLAANGGGGGGGGYFDELSNLPDLGAPGADGAVGITPAAGGVNRSTYGNGASGAANLTAPSSGASSPGGGGGGGGGVGRIHRASGTLTGTGGVSSPPVE